MEPVLGGRVGRTTGGGIRLGDDALAGQDAVSGVFNHVCPCGRAYREDSRPGARRRKRVFHEGESARGLAIHARHRNFHRRVDRRAFRSQLQMGGSAADLAGTVRPVGEAENDFGIFRRGDCDDWRPYGGWLSQRARAQRIDAALSQRIRGVGHVFRLRRIDGGGALRWETIMKTDLALGLITGIIFGFLLQKGRVLRFEKQVGALRLADMTILKFMLSAILVGMVGIQLLAAADVLKLSHKAMNFGAVLLGGALFGIGWAFVGYCPGTAIGALGEGRWHALFAIAGMITGAALYAELYPFIKRTVLAWRDYGKIGLAEALGISPWVVVVVCWGGALALFAGFEKKKM